MKQRRTARGGDCGRQAQGRSKQYPRYWCWQKGCNSVGVSKDKLETQFVELFQMMQPTGELIARLPQISASNWELRKKRAGDDRRALQTRLNEQNALNRRAIETKLATCRLKIRIVQSRSDDSDGRD